MARIDKKANWDEFTIKDGKQCIGGYEILNIWHGLSNGWYWYATKVSTKNKEANIYEGFVKGFESEWGSWYASDMGNPLIEEVPKANWNNCVPINA
jgi:hypothetical protein